MSVLTPSWSRAMMTPIPSRTLEMARLTRLARIGETLRRALSTKRADDLAAASGQDDHQDRHEGFRHEADGGVEQLVGLIGIEDDEDPDHDRREDDHWYQLLDQLSQLLRGPFGKHLPDDQGNDDDDGNGDGRSDGGLQVHLRSSPMPYTRNASPILAKIPPPSLMTAITNSSRPTTRMTGSLKSCLELAVPQFGQEGLTLVAGQDMLIDGIVDALGEVDPLNVGDGADCSLPVLHVDLERPSGPEYSGADGIERKVELAGDVLVGQMLQLAQDQRLPEGRRGADRLLRPLPGRDQKLPPIAPGPPRWRPVSRASSRSGIHGGG